MSRSKPGPLVSFFRFFAIAFLAVGLLAQDYRGRLQGFITDSSDAPVAGARVTVLNINTGVATARESGENGAYLFDNVEPGIYTVTAELQGFTRQVKENVLVQTRQDVTVNFTLQPGAVVESVTVEGQTTALQFNTATRELTVDRRMLMDLPVKARNPFTLALLDPAVVNLYTGERNPFFMWSASSIDVGGMTYRQNDLVIDGAPVQIGPKGSYSPPMDATQEFSVQQNSVDAEFGHTAGGTLSVSTKSGTNEYHGTAYYFGRNPVLNAVADRTKPERPGNFIRNHIWGGTVGGPIKRNQLFTFFAYEGWRVNEPRSTQRTMPTPLERVGDFSQSRTRLSELRTIYDPTTSAPDGTRQPFPNNVIPPNRIDPTAARIMQDIGEWGPNNPGDDPAGTNNFRASYTLPTKNWNFTNRTDWNVSDRLKVFGRYSQFKTTVHQENYTPNDSRAMPNDNDGIMNSRNVAGDLVYTASPRTVFNFRGSFASLEDDYRAPKPYAIGREGLEYFWPNNPWYREYLTKDIPAIYYPQINMNYTTAPCSNSNPCTTTFGKSSYYIQHPRHYAFSGKVSHARGSHYLKAGAEYRHHVGEGIYPNLMNFTFYSDMTGATYNQANPAASGDPWASFLLGTIDQRSNAGARPYLAVHIPFVGVFVHDDWKISRRVTLNLGLRYEWESGPYDEQDQYSRTLDLNAPNNLIRDNPPNIPREVLALTTPKWNGQWIFTDGGNRKAWTTQKNIFLPRIGMAVRVNDKTALNIGWGRYVVPISTIARTLDACLWCSGFSQTSKPLTMNAGQPQAFLLNPFPASNRLIPVVEKQYGVNTNVGADATFPSQNYKAQTNDRVNFTIMRELPGQFKADATWFMHFGRHAPVLGDQLMNMVDPNLIYTLGDRSTTTVDNPFFQYLTPEVFPGSLRNSETVELRQLLRPYPHYGDLTMQNVGIARARYQALQLRVQRSYTAGSMILFAYNYNQERQEAYFNDPQRYVRQFFWLPSVSARHRLTLAGSYEVPVGKGRKFGSNMHPVLNAALGGWQFSGIYTYRSGNYLRFPEAEAVGDPHVENPGPNGWFNPDAFQPLPGSAGTKFAPRLNPWQYDDIKGPILWNLDGTVSKSFPIRERYRLEFRFEAYNLTNSLMWANPSPSLGPGFNGRSTAAANRGREMQYTLRFHF